MHLIFSMALDTQGFFTVEPRMKIIVGALGGMTACAGHHLPGARIKNFFADGVGKHAVFPMTFAADRI